MDSTRRPLTSKERQELMGIVSPWIAIGRAVLFVMIVAAICGVCRMLNRFTPDFLWWPIPGGLAGWYLYRASSVLTGGADLRSLIRQDLAAGFVEEHTFIIESVIVFPAVEDEGPVWCFPHDGKTWCVSGQWLDRIVKDEAPRRMLIVSMTPNAQRIMRLKASGPPAEILHSEIPFFDCSAVKNFKLTKTLTELPVAWSEIASTLAHLGTTGQSKHVSP